MIASTMNVCALIIMQINKPHSVDEKKYKYYYSIVGRYISVSSFRNSKLRADTQPNVILVLLGEAVIFPSRSSVICNFFGVPEYCSARVKLVLGKHRVKLLFRRWHQDLQARYSLKAAWHGIFPIIAQSVHRTTSTTLSPPCTITIMCVQQISNAAVPPPLGTGGIPH